MGGVEWFLTFRSESMMGLRDDGRLRTSRILPSCIGQRGASAIHRGFGLGFELPILDA